MQCTRTARSAHSARPAAAPAGLAHSGVAVIAPGPRRGPFLPPRPPTSCSPSSPAGPFEDALKLHERAVAVGVAVAPPPSEDRWPSPPTRRAPVAPTEEQLRQEPWYHGQMSRRAAEKLLRADGDFLVRDSVTNPGQYVLTGMHAGQPRHLLLVDPEGVVRRARGGRGGLGSPLGFPCFRCFPRQGPSVASPWAAGGASELELIPAQAF